MKVPKLPDELYAVYEPDDSTDSVVLTARECLDDLPIEWDQVSRVGRYQLVESFDATLGIQTSRHDWPETQMEDRKSFLFPGDDLITGEYGTDRPSKVKKQLTKKKQDG